MEGISNGAKLKLRESRQYPSGNVVLRYEQADA
jgi:hypothetical protein